jgi:hypothetical protein
MPERGNEIDASVLVAVGMGRKAMSTLELIVASGKDVCGFDDISLDSAGNADDFPYPSMPCGVDTEMDDQIHTGRDRWDHKCRGHVLASQ